MKKRKAIQLTIEFFVDLFSLVIATGISYAISLWIDKIPTLDREETLTYFVLMFVAYCLIFFGFSNSLDLTKRDRLMETVSVIRNSLLIFMTFAVLLMLAKNKLITSRYLFVLSLAFFIGFSLLNRYISKHVMLFHSANLKFVNLAGVITIYDRAEEYTSKLDEDWLRRIKGIVLIDAHKKSGSYYCKVGSENAAKEKRVSNINGIPVVANLTGVLDWVRSESLDEVFINVPYKYEKSVDRIAEEIESMGVTVHINLPSLEHYIDNSEFDNVELTVAGGYPTATLTAAPPLSFSAGIMKRSFDIFGGLVGSIISLPIILITAVPLLIESPGPLIFKQQRVGKNGRIFNIYKLRSMYTDAEKRKAELMANNKMSGFMFKMDNDPRITKVGKFIRKTSIDELPQFWNVLKGDMSLVGTRPPTIDEFDKYESHHKRRLSMRPGITGMWQVSGRSDIQNFEDVVRLDCEYIDNWSPALDLKILFKTVWVVLKGSGAE